MGTPLLKDQVHITIEIVGDYYSIKDLLGGVNGQVFHKDKQDEAMAFILELSQRIIGKIK